ncbi:NUDIX hydrolase [Fredinandcohnia humi]
MGTWFGAAGICINEHNELLMVLQGKPDEKKLWAVPSGGKEGQESFEECCIREIREETGYDVEIVQSLHIKKGITYGIPVEVHYFEVQIIGGESSIQDPDGLIYKVAWKSEEETAHLELSFEEDRDFLLTYLKKRRTSKYYDSNGTPTIARNDKE